MRQFIWDDEMFPSASCVKWYKMSGASKVTFWTRENGILIPARKRSSTRHTQTRKKDSSGMAVQFTEFLYIVDKTKQSRDVSLLLYYHKIKKAKSVYFYEMVWFQFSEDVSSFIQQQWKIQEIATHKRLCCWSKHLLCVVAVNSNTF